jgi:hypothetical protein
VVGPLEDSRRVHRDPWGLETGHSTVEARLQIYRNWDLLSFAPLVGVKTLRAAGLEVVVGEEAVEAGVVELADSGSGSA